jgi:hypothetical protein
MLPVSAAREVRAAGYQERTQSMTIDFQSARRVVVSFVAALAFAAVAVGTAVPILPVA